MDLLGQTTTGYQSGMQRRSDGRGGALQQQQPEVNVGGGERMVSVAAGTILGLLGLSRGSLPGLVVAGVGGALAYRGVTGRCATYRMLQVNTAHQLTGGQTREEQIAQDGVLIRQSFGINRPPEQLYQFWRNFENLPQIMTHVESVTVMDEGRSRWVAKARGLGGKRFEWNAEITRDVPNERISWRSLPGADIDNTGEVRFSPGMGDRSTEVHVEISYLPPAGRVGHWIASMLGENPKRVVREDLRNFKRLMEIREIPTIIGQPHGTCKGQGERYTESDWKPLLT